MEARVTSAPNHDVLTAIGLLTRAVHASGADPLALELVHLRASQINGCGPCVFAGVAAAYTHGETDERLHNVVAWRETSFYTDAERAALALAEAATRIQDGAPGVTDEIWAAAAEHFEERHRSALVLNIALTQFFNRLNHTFRQQAGVTW